MKLFVFSIVGSLAFGGDLQLPKSYLDKIVSQLEEAGESGVDTGKSFDRSRSLMPSGSVQIPHWVHCSVPQNGFLESITQEDSNGFNPKGKFAVNIIHREGTEGEFIRVKDAKVSVSNSMLFDTTKSGNWGLGGPSETTTKSYAVKMTVSSKKHVLGHKIEGCIGRPVHEVELVLMCYDASTKWRRRP